jgi:hypothetical protein
MIFFPSTATYKVNGTRVFCMTTSDLTAVRMMVVMVHRMVRMAHTTVTLRTMTRAMLEILIVTHGMILASSWFDAVTFFAAILITATWTPAIHLPTATMAPSLDG